MQAEKIIAFLHRALVLPLLLVCRTAPSRPALERDMRRLHQQRLDLPLPEHLTLSQELAALAIPEFRSVLYCRLCIDGFFWRLLETVLKRLWPGRATFSMACPDIGPGLYI